MVNRQDGRLPTSPDETRERRVREANAVGVDTPAAEAVAASTTASIAPIESSPSAGGAADAQLTQLVQAWARLGAAFNVTPCRKTPDLERLLIETVRSGRSHARLLTMTVTWLSYYGILVARHRLARMAVERLTAEERAVLAWLFEEAASHARRRPRPQAAGSPEAPAAPELRGGSVKQSRFAGAAPVARITISAGGKGGAGSITVGRSFRARELLAVCRPAVTRVPVFTVDSRHPVLLRRLADRSSAIARRWNVLAGPIDRKPDALRPAAWILAHNPSLGVRGLLEGDLRASILAAIEHDPGAGASELELARRCGASRAAVRQALSRLEFAGLVLRWHVGTRHAIGCCLPGGQLAGQLAGQLGGQPVAHPGGSPSLAAPGATDGVGTEALDHAVGDAVDPPSPLVVGNGEEPRAVAE